MSVEKTNQVDATNALLQRRGVLPAGEINLNANTVRLVDDFAAALKKKLAIAEAKYGYQDGWMRDDWHPELLKELREHVEKGDPRDVAAYCAFAWYHNWKTAESCSRCKGSGVSVSHPYDRPECEVCEGTGVAGRPIKALVGEDSHALTSAATGDQRGEDPCFDAIRYGGKEMMAIASRRSVESIVSTDKNYWKVLAEKLEAAWLFVKAERKNQANE